MSDGQRDASSMPRNRRDCVDQRDGVEGGGWIRILRRNAQLVHERQRGSRGGDTISLLTPPGRGVVPKAVEI